MTYPFIDTDVIIRFLTGDDPAKQERAAALFERIEQGAIVVAAPSTVIADAVYVLASPRLYNLARDQVAAMLGPLVRLRGFRVKNRKAVLAALALYGYGPTKIDFGDAMIAATMQQSGSEVVYSFDADFSRIPGVQRREP